MYLLDQGIDARQALDWGLVNEVVSREQLMQRAREIAEKIMRPHRVVRRLTTQLVRRPWRKAITSDFQMHFGHEMFGANVSRVSHVENADQLPSSR